MLNARALLIYFIDELNIMVRICWAQSPNSSLRSSSPFDNHKLVCCESVSVLEISSFVLYFYISCIADAAWYLSFPFWPTSRGMITSRSILATANGMTSLFCVAEKHSRVYLCPIFFLHASACDSRGSQATEATVREGQPLESAVCSSLEGAERRRGPQSVSM